MRSLPLLAEFSQEMATPQKHIPSDASIAPRLLAWYDRHHRELPWRTPPGATASGHRPDPYHVWLSEIMLQQTTVEAVKPFFRAFLARWPTLAALAAASEEDVLKMWAGLGYYSRARNLKKCANMVASIHAGRFPDTEQGLRELPGVGAYTAAAIAAIAFDRPAAVVDGNVERVVSRLGAISTPLPEAKSQIRAIVASLVPALRPGDFAQATMDLGATICTPRRPSCMLCPVNDDCEALAAGDPELYPVKAGKADKPRRVGAAYVAVRENGFVLLRKRPDKGLLGGMSEVPTTAWTARIDGDTTTASAPFATNWRRTGSITHVFTHFSLELVVYRADVADMDALPGHRWASLDAIREEALPTVMMKVVEAAIPDITRRDAGKLQ